VQDRHSFVLFVAQACSVTVNRLGHHLHKEYTAVKAIMPSLHGILLCWMATLSWVAGNDTDLTQPVVGTIDGYDVGGNRSICWTSQFDDSTIANNNDSPGTTLIRMNQELHDDPDAVSFQQLPTCFQNGTSMSVKLKEDEELLGRQEELWVMWKGSKKSTSVPSAIFEIDLRVNLDDYDNIPAVDYITVWYRILMCVVPLVGFCQPLIDSPQWDGYNNPVLEERPRLPLDSVPTDNSTKLTFRTNWTVDTLVPDGTNSRMFSGKIVLPVVCWSSMDDADYAVIAHATMALPTGTGEILRVDVSSELPGDPLDVANKPDVKVFDSGAMIFVGILIGVGGFMTLGMFVYIILHRNHRVMTMAQAGLLSGLAAASCTTIVMSFLLMPIDDIFCKLDGLLFIPATLMPTILVGRLWRVHTTLAVAYSLGRGTSNLTSSVDKSGSSSKFSNMRQQTRTSLSKFSKKSEEWVMKFLTLLACSPCIQNLERRRSLPSQIRSTSSLRRTTTRKETLILIFFLTLPQVVVQTVDVFIHWGEARLTEEYADDFSSARKSCWSKTWMTFFGGGYLAAMFVLAMYVAWCSRNLPSAFNEKDAVFKAGFVNGVIVIVVTVGLSFSDIPQVSPNLTVSFMVIMTVGVSLLTSWFVIMPKIRRVHDGETVVVTNILRDMNGVRTSSLSSEEEEYRRASLEAAVASRISSAGVVTSTSSSTSSRKRVTHSKKILKFDEPIPKQIERQLYQLNELVDSVTDRW
jgi:hypothetical protein